MAQAVKGEAGRARRSRRRKERLTLSLDAGTVQFLRRRQSEVKAPSLSALVEEIVEANKLQAETAELNAQIGAYYDAISDREREEDSAWGELAGNTLASMED